VPRSELDGLTGTLGLLEARRALWGSIGAWEGSVAEWRSTPFEQLNIHAEVPITPSVSSGACRSCECMCAYNCGCDGILTVIDAEKLGRNA
jgi:hypothetical protein